MVVVVVVGLTAIVKVFVVVVVEAVGLVEGAFHSNQGVSATAVVGSEKGREEFAELDVIREF